MIEIFRHIEALLLEHDCVIVPGLGGFVTQYVSARRVAEEQLFLPPHRTVGFNARLTLNDGLLVQSFMQTYGTGYPESVRLIDDAVNDLKRELQENGAYELKGIGTLTLNLNGDYNFSPNEAGVLSPELYGLSSFSANPLRFTGKSRGEKSLLQDFAPAEPKSKKKKTYTVSINRELCNYVAAAVVAIVFYFLWATPMGNTVDRDGGMSAAGMHINITPLEHQDAPTMSAPAVAVPSAAQPDKPAATPKASPAPKVEKAAEAAEKPVVTGNYTLVLISDVPRENAEKYVEQLHRQGINEAAVFVRRKMVRVVCGNYEKKNEAHNALRSLRNEHPQFKEAWVMSIK